MMKRTSDIPLTNIWGRCYNIVMKGKKSDLANKKFGRLTVIIDTSERKNKHIIWLCKCDCGNYIELRSCSLKHGNTRSCGCFNREVVSRMASSHRGNESHLYKHGETAYFAIGSPPSRLYACWAGMKSRCTNPRATGYKNYGGRGISICSEWNDYIPFRAWALTHGYKDNLTIDRIDNDGNYEPSNCQFITQSENSKKGGKGFEKDI